MEKSCKNIWAKCLKLIEEQLPPKTFKTWFEPIRPLKFKDDVLTIQVASNYVYECLEERFIDILRNSLKAVIGPNAKLEYSVVVENQPKAPLTTTLS
ncbi:MAG: chromosomal replication initiator protein DnaA, partial [Odoribacter sp.]|nr:chromosomal replication initiator protein DnaA [Odoribacter sp.]